MEAIVPLGGNEPHADLILALSERQDTEARATKLSAFSPIRLQRRQQAFATLLMADLGSPDAILQDFTELLIGLCQADSAGVSI